MSRHAVRATVAIAALSLAVLGPPVQAQDNPSTQELADLRDHAEAGDADAQFTLGEFYTAGEGVPQDDAEAIAWYSGRSTPEFGCSSETTILWQYIRSPWRHFVFSGILLNREV